MGWSQASDRSERIEKEERETDRFMQSPPAGFIRCGACQILVEAASATSGSRLVD